MQRHKRYLSRVAALLERTDGLRDLCCSVLPGLAQAYPQDEQQFFDRANAAVRGLRDVAELLAPAGAAAGEGASASS